MASQKTLTILRHAKAETASASQDDKNRGLTSAGLDAASRMGRYMAGNGLLPESAFCSTAERARETWVRVQQSAGQKVDTRYLEKLYLATAGDIIALLGEASDAQDNILVVGHNPGLHELTLRLARRGEPGLLDALHVKYPTCALAVVTFDSLLSWKELGYTYGTLTVFATPRLLAAA